MHTYSLTHLADGTLLGNLNSLVTRDRKSTAELLAHLAEVESRRHYAKAGYSSMFEYCVRELRLSEDATYKRLRAARAARRFPAIFAAMAEGRLHVSGVVLLTPFLTQTTAVELLAAAEHKSKREIELLLAERFPQPDLPTRVVALTSQLAPGLVETCAATPELLAQGPAEALASRPSAPAPELDAASLPPPCQLAPGPVAQPGLRSKITPLSPGRFGAQFTMDQAMHDKLTHAQALLSHRIPSSDFVQVMHLALDALITQLEKRKFAATDRPHQAQRDATGKRCIPAAVRRAVSKRDGDSRTFVSDIGKRCDARARLEFDHVLEVARGGQATVGNIRLRCRTHNTEGSFRHGAVRMSWVEALTAERHAGKNLLN